MPRVIDGVEKITDDERNALAKQARVEVKAEAKPVSKELKTEGISKAESNVPEIQVFGMNIERKANPDKNFEQAFKFVPCKKKGWISMTNEEALEYQEQGLLVGHDAINEIGLLKKDE